MLIIIINILFSNTRTCYLKLVRKVFVLEYNYYESEKKMLDLLKVFLRYTKNSKKTQLSKLWKRGENYYYEWRNSRLHFAYLPHLLTCFFLIFQRN